MWSKDERIGISRGFAHGQSGLDVVNGLNHNYRLISVLLQASVKSASLISEPLNDRKDGDAYIIPFDATGVWETHKGQIAQWDATTGNWFYLVVKKGFSFFIEDVDQYKIFTANGWKSLVLET